MKRTELKPNPDRLTSEQLRRNSTFAPAIAREVEYRGRTPLKPVSDRRKAENAVRRRVLAEMRQEDPMCARCKRSEEHTSELQSLMRISYAVFCSNKKRTQRRLTSKQYTKSHLAKHSQTNTK